MEKQGSLSWFSRELTKSELMIFYSVAIPTVLHIDISKARGTILCYLFSYSILWKRIVCAIDQLFDINDVVDDLICSKRYQSDSAQCFLKSE